MKRNNIQTLGEALREYVREMRMDRKLKEVSIVQSWENVLGKTIARYTRNVYLSNGVLYVELSSPVVKNELLMMREEIRNKLNENAGEELIRKVVFK